MVKGISRQVIVVNPGSSGLFDQAIFILRDSAVREGVTEDMLMKEAKQAIGRPRKRSLWKNLLFFLLGAGITGLAWGLLSLL